MGLLSKARALTGAVPKELLEEGLLVRGIIVDVAQTSVSTGPDFDPAHVCVFTLEVALDDVPRYTASCRQAVRATVLPRLGCLARPLQCASIATTTAGSRSRLRRSRRP